MKLTNLRDARRRKGWTQDRLAEASGIDQTTISRLETDANPNPTEATKNALAKALGIRPVQLRFSPPEPAEIGTRDRDRSGHEVTR